MWLVETHRVLLRLLMLLSMQYGAHQKPQSVKPPRLIFIMRGGICWIMFCWLFCGRNSLRAIKKYSIFSWKSVISQKCFCQAQGQTTASDMWPYTCSRWLALFQGSIHYSISFQLRGGPFMSWNWRSGETTVYQSDILSALWCIINGYPNIARSFIPESKTTIFF